MAFDIGDTLPKLTLPASGDQQIKLGGTRKTGLVLYFYPKDNTPGCTQEGQDFRDLHAEFVKAGAEIIGVSRDSVRTHDNFIAKHEFPFPLISDADETLCQALDVIKEKTLYGRKYMGVDRSTFLFDRKGVLRAVWRGVKVKGHAAAVLDAVKKL